ncbi:hypothetical protein V7796_20365 [Rhizobium laguerreae]
MIENDKQRFSDAYKRFKEGAAAREQLTGTPLSQWPYLKPSQIKELEAVNIYTVEQLAALSDTVKQKIGMGRTSLSLPPGPIWQPLKTPVPPRPLPPKTSG